MEPPAPHAPDAPPARAPRRTIPLLLVAVLAWAVPGLGHALLGRWRTALIMALAILVTYVGGLWLTGFTAVHPERYWLEFYAHVFAGGPTALTLHLTEGVEQTTILPHLDVGRLYVAVASLLNVVAATDALGIAARRNHGVRGRRAAAAHAQAVARWEAAHGTRTIDVATIDIEPAPEGFAPEGTA